jgi:coenzyme A diphosphatase NUDT7
MAEKYKEFERFEALWKDQELRPDRSLPIWESAVLLPLLKGKNGWEILFEVRSRKLNWQPGDICFPGGHRDEGDSSREATAVRETREELGLAAEDIQVLGPLEYFYAPMGPIIFPYAGIITAKSSYQLSTGEVDEIFTAPVKELLAIQPSTAKSTMGIKYGPGFPPQLGYKENTKWRETYQYDLLFYPYEGHVIWGITARVLHNFLKRLQEAGF